MTDESDRAFNVFSFGWNDDGRLGLQFDKDIARIKEDRIQAKAEAERRKKMMEAEVEDDEEESSEEEDENGMMTSRSNRSRKEESHHHKPDYNRKTLARRVKHRLYGSAEEPEPTFGAISLPRPIASIGTQEKSRGVRVAAGYYHSLMTNPQGQVLAFGDGRHGQLGLGQGITPLVVDVPQQVAMPDVSTYSAKLNRDIQAPAFIKTVEAGNGFSVAVTADGKMYSWGWGKFGALGHEEGQGNEHIPRLVAKLSSLRITQVSCGGSHVLALTSTGRLYSWGANHHGQLGRGVEPHHKFEFSDQITAVVFPNPATEKPIAVAAGESHSIALVKVDRADGKVENCVHGWGNNANGRLGRVDPLTTGAPREIQNLTTVLRKYRVDVVSIAAGGGHNLGITSGAHNPISWGAGGFGQLGTGDIWDREQPYVNVDIRGILAVSAGRRHSLAIVSVGLAEVKGKLYAWGWGNWGELGLGDTKCRLQPTMVMALDDALCTAITAGDKHSLCVTPGLVRKARDVPVYARYIKLLQENGPLAYKSLKRDMESKGLNSEFLDNPDHIFPGQPGQEDKPTEIDIYERGLRYCLDTCAVSDENRDLRGTYETVYRVPSVGLKAVCMACSRRCHSGVFVETTMRVWDPAVKCDCQSSSHCVCMWSEQRHCFDMLADKYRTKKPIKGENEKLAMDYLNELLVMLRDSKGGISEDDLENAQSFLISEGGGPFPFDWFQFEKWYRSYYAHEFAIAELGDG